MEDRLKSMSSPSNPANRSPAAPVPPRISNSSNDHRFGRPALIPNPQAASVQDDSNSGKNGSNCICQRLSMFVLDISQALESQVVSWMDVRSNASLEAPDETILYSLTLGRSELILFGGIQKDVSSMTMRSSQAHNSADVSNSVYYLTPP